MDSDHSRGPDPATGARATAAERTALALRDAVRSFARGMELGSAWDADPGSGGRRLPVEEDGSPARNGFGVPTRRA
ncbi:hypothetical protein AB0D30_10675 [Streptomyces sp. NPDC048409]|uniref:hypothetical protein n=1 Tax=Streptomyces sp. NPDC048409 TaxID=3154723 RepID=UPI00341CF7CD